MTEWWRPLAAALREADRFGPTGRLARQAYQLVARAAARLFGSIDEVDCVYLTGSLTRPRLLRPGLSDIDLVISADLPTIRAEERLRWKLRRAHRALQAIAPVFTNLDYFETQDLDFLRYLGNAWCLDLDVRWRPLAGAGALLPRPVLRPRRERDLLLLSRCFKRWMKSSALLASRRDARATSLGRRLLADVLAGWLDADRLTPLATLLDRAGKTGRLPPSLDLSENPEPPLDVCLSAALQVLDRWANDRSRGWLDPWVVSVSPCSPELPRAVRTTARRLARALGADCVLAPRGCVEGGALLFAVVTGPLDIAATRRELGRMGPLPDPLRWAPWPILLTPALYRTLALAPPEPFVAAAIAHGANWLRGHAPPPPAPPSDDLRTLLLARTVRQMMRRLERPRRGASTWRLEQAYERDWLLPALARALDGESYDLRAEGHASQGLDDVSRLREWIAGRRPRLAPELAKHRGSVSGRSPPGDAPGAPAPRCSSR